MCVIAAAAAGSRAPPEERRTPTCSGHGKQNNHYLVDVYPEICGMICTKILTVSISVFIADYRFSIQWPRLYLRTEIAAARVGAWTCGGRATTVTTFVDRVLA